MVNKGVIMRIWNKRKGDKAMDAEIIQLPAFGQGYLFIAILIRSRLSYTLRHGGKNASLVFAGACQAFYSSKIGNLIQALKACDILPYFIHKNKYLIMV